MILFIHSRFRDTLHDYEIICTRKHSFYKTRMKRNVLLTKLYPSFWVLMSHYCSFARYSLIIYICSLRSYIFTIFFAQLDISWIKKPTAHDFTFNSLLNTKNFGIEIFSLDICSTTKIIVNRKGYRKALALSLVKIIRVAMLFRTAYLDTSSSKKANSRTKEVWDLTAWGVNNDISCCM